jgi:hypothetical protein
MGNQECKAQDGDKQSKKHNTENQSDEQNHTKQYQFYQYIFCLLFLASPLLYTLRQFPPLTKLTDEIKLE